MQSGAARIGCAARPSPCQSGSHACPPTSSVAGSHLPASLSGTLSGAWLASPFSVRPLLPRRVRGRTRSQARHPVATLPACPALLPTPTRTHACIPEAHSIRAWGFPRRTSLPGAHRPLGRARREGGGGPESAQGRGPPTTGPCKEGGSWARNPAQIQDQKTAPPLVTPTVGPVLGLFGLVSATAPLMISCYMAP